MSSRTTRPLSGATGWAGERGLARPSMHFFQDSAGYHWYAWTDTNGQLRIAEAATVEAAGFNFNTGGSVVNQAASLTAGAGVSAAETYNAKVSREGNLAITRIVVDLTGLAASTTDLDIIGNPAGATSAHFGQITSAINGVIFGGQMTCLELPAAAVTDIDLYSATVSTGAQDGGIAALVETALVTAAAAWTNGMVKGLTGVPPANDYLYIVGGAAGVTGTYTGGKFLIELFGIIP